MATFETGLTLPPYVEFGSAANLPELRVGESLADGRYQLHGTISRRAASEVVIATDWESKNGDNPYVAVKILHEPHLRVRSQGDTMLATHAVLDGKPGIVPLRDMGILERAEGQPRRYLATELATDGSLLEVAKKDPRNLDMLLQMGRDVLTGLESMHESGIVHCDVKPGNILASQERERWALTDFDIVETIGAVRVHDLIRRSLGYYVTSEGSRPVLGTVGYIAPENFQDDIPIGPKVDVFAMGVTMYEIATGELPFRSKTLKDYTAAVTRESPVSARALNRTIPLRLDVLSRDCMRPDPRDRPTTGELLSGLQAM